jgi:small subunit ribosomal protein S1
MVFLAAATSSAFVAGYNQVHVGDAVSRLQGSRVAVPARTPTMAATLDKWGQKQRDASRYASFAFNPEGLDTSSDVGFSYEELAASVGDIKKYTRGDTATGTVVSFEPNGAVVDIGVKSSAYCSLSEMALVKPDKPELVFSIGDEFEFVIMSREDENGQLFLSRRRILFQEAWDKVTEVHAEDGVVDAEVMAVNKGGAMLQVEGLRAFMPGSHYLPGQTPTETLVGQTLKIKFLDVDKEGNRLVASHKKAIVDSTMVDLTVGAVVKGYVTAVKPYGAFIDVGGISGLLHISQISCDHIADVAAVLPQGSEIKCMVISQDKGKGRIALSTKTLEAEPGDMIKDRAKVFENAEDTAAKYQERLEAERKAREEAAQDAIFGLESVFSDTTEPTEAAAEDDLPLAPVADLPLES